MFPKSHNRLDRFVTAGWVVLVIGLSVTSYVAFKPVHAKYTSQTDLALQQHEASMRSTPHPEASDFTVIWEGEPQLPNPTSQGTPSSIGASNTVTHLDFQLRGVFYQTSGLSMVCLSRNGQQSLYAVGDVIGDWQISDIDVQSVTVARNDETQTLRMGHPMYAYLPSHNAQAIGTDVTELWNETTPIVSPNGPSGDDAYQMRRTRKSSQPRKTQLKPADAAATVAVAASVIDRLREDPASVKFGAGFIPNLDKNGKMQGILLNNIEPGSLAAQYGLAPGDRILSINGESISSLARGMQLYQRYRGNDSVSVTIQRGGLLKNVLFYAR